MTDRRREGRTDYYNKYIGSQRLNCVFTNKTKLKNIIIYNT